MARSCYAAALINGYDGLNITKLDVLDDLAEIKIAAKYLADGKELPGFLGYSASNFIRSGRSDGRISADLAMLSSVDV
jgi:hypothetical protein